MYVTHFPPNSDIGPHAAPSPGWDGGAGAPGSRALIGCWAGHRAISGGWACQTLSRPLACLPGARPAPPPPPPPNVRQPSFCPVSVDLGEQTTGTGRRSLWDRLSPRHAPRVLCHAASLAAGALLSWMAGPQAVDSLTCTSGLFQFAAVTNRAAVDMNVEIVLKTLL